MQQYNQNEICTILEISLDTLSHFQRTQERAKKKGIILTKTGIGKKAIYTLEYIKNFNIINEGLEINGIKWPEIVLGQAKNIKNKKFGKLTPLYRTNDYIMSNGNKEVQWVCQCDCGNLTVVRTNAMQTGNTLSCGCLFKAHDWHTSTFKDLTNQRFGKLTVIEYKGLSEGKRSLWLCQCDCGKQRIVNARELLKGDTISCGCSKSSLGELNIEKILKENNIFYKKEYQFNDLVSENGTPLRFDFAIFEDANMNILKYLIEYDGEQHYLNKTDKLWTTTLTQNQQRDQQKNRYCLKHNIKLYRIPYWDKMKINNLDILTNNKYLII